MKILILSTLLIASIFGQNCQIYTCGSLTAPECVGTAAAATTTNVQACPSGQYCALMQAPFVAGVIANTSCANNPKPTPINSLAPGDYCNTANGDQCANAQTTCQSSVCTTTNKIGGACTLDSDCPVGGYCNIAGDKTCTAIVAPGGACTPLQSVSTLASQCGFGAYCVNSKCTLIYSIASGQDTGVPLSISGGFAALLCQTLEASTSTATWYCVPSPYNQDQTTLTTGVPSTATCTVVTTNADGTTSTSTSAPICGYNQNGNSYCAW